MIDDPIMKELRKHKIEIAKECNNDIDLLIESLNQEAIEDGITVVDRSRKKAIEKTGA